MQVLERQAADTLISGNKDHIFIVIQDNEPVQGMGFAGFIGFSEEALRIFFDSLRSAFPRDLSNFEIARIEDILYLEDLNSLFETAQEKGLVCDKIACAEHGIISRADASGNREDVIGFLAEKMEGLPDTARLYTVLYQDGRDYCENNCQSVFFSLDAAYEVIFRIDGKLNEISDLIAPLFTDFIPDTLRLSAYGQVISGNELKRAIKKHFEESCLSQKEIADLLQFPLMIYCSIDGSNLVMLHYGQTVFFTDKKKLLAFPKNGMPELSEEYTVKEPSFYEELIQSKYIFFDGERHCRVQDFWKAAR